MLRGNHEQQPKRIKRIVEARDEKACRGHLVFSHSGDQTDIFGLVEFFLSHDMFSSVKKGRDIC